MVEKTVGRFVYPIFVATSRKAAASKCTSQQVAASLLLFQLDVSGHFLKNPVLIY